MITEWVTGLFVNIGLWLTTLFPPPPEDMGEVIAALDERVNSVMAQAAGLGPWLDWGFALIVVGIVVSIWLVGIIIRLVRWVISFVPTMSGGT